MPKHYTFLLSDNLAKGRYTLFAGGDNAPGADELSALEAQIGYELPEDFKDYSMSSLGGLYVEVNEDIWPRPKAHDAGAFWTFLYGLYVYGMGAEVQEWMDISAYQDFQERSGSNYLPFLQVRAFTNGIMRQGNSRR